MVGTKLCHLIIKAVGTVIYSDFFVIDSDMLMSRCGVVLEK